MIKNSQYITLKEVLSRVLRHPKLKEEVDLEAAIQYAVDFIEAVGTPDMFEQKEVIVSIKGFRGELPCDLVSVLAVKDNSTGISMRSTSDNFMPQHSGTSYRTCRYNYLEEATFKTQNTTIITSIENGEVIISYKAIPVDEDGMPLLLNNSTYLKALELYIKKEVFTYLYDDDKIKPGPLQNAQQEYAWAVGKLQSEMTIPSEAEMETICRSWTTLLQRTTEFDSGFKYNGNREYNRLH